MKKKLGLFYSRSHTYPSSIFFCYIFHIKDDDGEAFDVDIYKLHSQKGKTAKTSRKVVYSTWTNIAPYSAATELDEDVMRGLILEVFGETA